MRPFLRLATTWFGLTAMLSWLGGCATVEADHIGVQLNGPNSGNKTTGAGLVISGEENTSFSSPYFGAILFNFANTTGEWIDVRNVGLTFGDQKTDDSVYLVSRTALGDWLHMVVEKEAMDRAKDEAALSALGLLSVTAAGVGAATGSRRGMAAAGLGLASASLFADLARWLDSARVANNVRFVQSQHLLAGDFRVPPGMSVDRFLVVNTKDDNAVGYIKDALIRYQTGKGHEEVVKITFREPETSNSKWQQRLAEKLSVRKQMAPY
jgi:hypothetical protein